MSQLDVIVLLQVLFIAGGFIHSRMMATKMNSSTSITTKLDATMEAHTPILSSMAALLKSIDGELKLRKIE